MNSANISEGIYAPYECIVAEFRAFVPSRPYEKPKVVSETFFVMARSAEEARDLAIPKMPEHLFRSGNGRVFVREFIDDSFRQRSNWHPGEIDE
jgi:hypothetical protein